MWWPRAQKPYFVFRRNGRVHLNRQGSQFSRLLAAEVCASAVVILDTQSSEVVWRVLATHSIRQFPLHLPSRASPCAITFQLDSTRTAVSSHLYIHSFVHRAVTYPDIKYHWQTQLQTQHKSPITRHRHAFSSNSRGDQLVVCGCNKLCCRKPWSIRFDKPPCYTLSANPSFPKLISLAPIKRRGSTQPFAFIFSRPCVSVFATSVGSGNVSKRPTLSTYRFDLK